VPPWPAPGQRVQHSPRNHGAYAGGASYRAWAQSGETSCFTGMPSASSPIFECASPPDFGAGGAIFSGYPVGGGASYPKAGPCTSSSPCGGIDLANCAAARHTDDWQVLGPDTLSFGDCSVTRGSASCSTTDAGPDAGPPDAAVDAAPSTRCSGQYGECEGGCCHDGQCVPGTSDTVCGAGGYNCADCTAQGGGPDWTCHPVDTGFGIGGICCYPSGAVDNDPYQECATEGEAVFEGSCCTAPPDGGLTNAVCTGSYPSTTVKCN
jgi:hypothetical protein